MEPRKIIKIGEKSYAITLPKKWANILGLKPGDSVNLILDKTGVIHVHLVSRKPKSTVPSIVIEASKLDIDDVEEYIRGCYIEGLDSVTIKNFRQAETEVTELNEILLKLPGVLLLEPGFEDIVLKIAITEEVINVEEVITRMTRVLDMMFDNFEKYINTRNKEYAELVLKLDDELDRLDHLGQRLIRKRAKTKILSSREYLDLLDSLTIILNIEHIGDCLDRSIRVLLNKEDRWFKLRDQITEVIQIARKIVFDTLSGIKYPSIRLVKNIKKKRRELKKIIYDILISEPELSGSMNEFEIISTLCMDLSEINVYRLVRSMAT